MKKPPNKYKCVQVLLHSRGHACCVGALAHAHCNLGGSVRWRSAHTHTSVSCGCLWLVHVFGSVWRVIVGARGWRADCWEWYKLVQEMQQQQQLLQQQRRLHQQQQGQQVSLARVRAFSLSLLLSLSLSFFLSLSLPSALPLHSFLSVAHAFSLSRSPFPSSTWNEVHVRTRPHTHARTSDADNAAAARGAANA